jgi:mannose-6-phosphate isomerase-like protein (cupin superfamily)
MSRRSLTGLVLSMLAAGGVVSCSEDAPVSPSATSHTTAGVAAVALEQFAFSATLDPYKIHGLPDFLIHSKTPSDLIIQRSRFTGTGAWHTHPGFSYAYVLQGHIKLQKYSKKDGCTETQVYGPGDAYIKPPNEVHRAVVVGEEEWELIVRLNYPAGGPIAAPADDPGC